VNKQLKSDNQKLAFFKEHQGKFHQKNELTKKLEETINTILSGKKNPFFYSLKKKHMIIT
jgi:hypothetical protein